MNINDIKTIMQRCIWNIKTMFKLIFTLFQWKSLTRYIEHDSERLFVVRMNIVNISSHHEIYYVIKLYASKNSYQEGRDLAKWFCFTFYLMICQKGYHTSHGMNKRQMLLQTLVKYSTDIGFVFCSINHLTMHIQLSTICVDSELFLTRDWYFTVHFDSFCTD